MRKSKNSGQHQKMKIVEAKAKTVSRNNETENQSVSMTVNMAKHIFKMSKANDTLKNLVSVYTDEMWEMLITMANIYNNQFEGFIKDYESYIQAMPYKDPDTLLSLKSWFRVNLMLIYTEEIGESSPIDIMNTIIAMYLIKPFKVISNYEILELVIPIAEAKLDFNKFTIKEGDMYYFTKDIFNS